jgi:hypothetical protein
VLEAYSRLPAAVRDHGTIVSGVGVQKRRPRPRHVAFRAVITRHGISHIELAERCQPRTRFSYNAIGSYDRGILDRMRTRLRAEGLHSPERFRDIMAVRVGSFGEETAKIPNISTPYILAPGQFFSPAVASGGFHLYPSNVVIELTGFDREPAPGPLRAFWGAHPRRAQPT